MSELSHVAALTNPEVFRRLQGTLDDFPWESSLAKSVTEQFKSNLPDIEVPVLRSFLSNSLIVEEVNEFIEQVNDYRSLESESSIESVTKSVFEYYRSRLFVTIVTSNKDSLEDAIEKVKSIPDSSQTKELVPLNLGQLTPSKLFKEEIGGGEGVLKSQMRLVNESTPFNGYLPGSVVGVCMAPGVGKSAYMMYEAVPWAMLGKKILMIVLGDLMKFDFITRYTAVATSTDYFKVVTNPDHYFDGEIREIANNFDVLVEPARTVSVEDILRIVSKKRYDVVCVDYDANLKQPFESSYESGGYIYDTLTQIARPKDQPYRLVMVASQAKNMYWEAERIPEDGLADSSKKQHNLDMLITGGKANSKSPCGIFSLEKVRRGKLGSVPYLRTECGHFQELTAEQYAMRKSYGK